MIYTFSTIGQQDNHLQQASIARRFYPQTQSHRVEMPTIPAGKRLCSTRQAMLINGEAVVTPYYKGPTPTHAASLYHLPTGRPGHTGRTHALARRPVVPGGAGIGVFGDGRRRTRSLGALATSTQGLVAGRWQHDGTRYLEHALHRHACLSTALSRPSWTVADLGFPGAGGGRRPGRRGGDGPQGAVRHTQDHRGMPAGAGALPPCTTPAWRPWRHLPACDSRPFPYCSHC